MKGVYAISLLIVSNIFMTFAWYGHLKLQETKMISNWPLYGVVLFSWSLRWQNILVRFRPIDWGLVGTGGHFH
jgi:uncharacterized protein (DUF486 family)